MFLTFKLALAERGGIAGNNDQLCLPRAKSLQRRLIAESDYVNRDNQHMCIDCVSNVPCLCQISYWSRSALVYRLSNKTTLTPAPGAS